MAQRVCYCPECGIEARSDKDPETDYHKGYGENDTWHLWCPMCEHAFEVTDLGLRPLGLE